MILVSHRTAWRRGGEARLPRGDHGTVKRSFTPRLLRQGVCGRRRRRYANEYAAIKHAPNAFIKNERETGNWRLSVLAARTIGGSGVGAIRTVKGEKEKSTRHES
jgi:hypothetical protein